MATKDETKARLDGYHARIRAVIERAWSDCRAVAAFKAEKGIGPLLYRRTLSNDVFDAIARHAIREFGSDASAKVKVEAQTIKVHFGGYVVARFKRGGSSRLGRNIQTQAVLNFVEAQRSMPDLPLEGAKVELIWITNDMQTAIDEVLVVARDGNRQIWEYEIPQESAGTGVVVPFPGGGSGPSESDDDTGDLVKPKTPAEKKTDEE